MNAASKSLLRAAAEDARLAQKHAAHAVVLIEAELPPGRPVYEITGVNAHGNNIFEPAWPWTPETARLRGLLTEIKSARSRAKRIAAEFDRYAEGRIR